MELFSVDPAWAPRALFHFQKLNVELRMPSADVFGEDGALSGKPENRALLVHELMHYLQGVSTVLGQRILLNWMAVVVGAAQHLVGVQPLPVPMNEAEAQREPRVARAVKELGEYLAEVAALVGAGHPLRPSSEAEPHGEYTFYEYSFPHPRDCVQTGATALRLTDPNGMAFGVPVLGDTLAEGMAQAAQWIAGDTAVTDEVLAARPRDPIPRDAVFDIYYTAIVRAVRRRLPDWDPRLTTLVLCDAALCSRYPGPTLAYILEKIVGKRPPSGIEGYKDVRRDLDRLKTLRDSKAFILDEIERADGGIPRDGIMLAPYFRRLFATFREAWQRREADPAILIDAEYGTSFLAATVSSLGAPPIFFSDKTHLISLSKDEQLLRACYLMRGCYEILVGLCTDGLASPCSLLHAKLCSHRKTDKCRTDLLSIPIADGNGCHIAFAATCLELHGRPLRRLK